MSKQFEQNFSLKDWVTKRAANMPEGVEEDVVIQVKAALEGGLKPDMTYKMESIQQKIAAPIHTDTEEPMANEAEDFLKQQTAKVSARMTAPASSLPTSPTQQIQIVRLLRDLGDRLRQSEKEREILWRELDSCRKLLTDIEDKTSNTEKAYLTLENKLNALPDAADSQQDKEFKKSIEDKINALETTTGSTVLRLEDAITENAKLARRLEQAAQDKTQLLRKMEALEEVVTQTQETLRAKALVLLTDHALANKTALPRTNAWSGNDTLRSQEAPVSPTNTVAENLVGIDDQPWWKNAKPVSMNKAGLTALVVLGLAGGWVFAKSDFASSMMPSFKPSVEKTKATAAMAPAKSEVKSEMRTDDLSKASSMEEAAQMANAIEPGDEVQNETVASAATTPAVTATDDTPVNNAIDIAKSAEQKALESFNDDTPVGSLASRIKPDTTLPQAVKTIQTKAFAGEGEAQHDLAAIYTAGHAGVKTNYLKASEWFTEAAHKGIANAQYNLAVLYHQGLGVKQDTQKAIDLYRVAASNNHPEAQYNLGIAHIEGIGAEYNPQVAAYYFQKAAEGGVVEAAYNIGLIQENGLLGEAQPDEAVFWYKVAADRGNKQAAEALTQLKKQLSLDTIKINQIYKRISEQNPQYLKNLAPVATAAPQNLVAPKTVAVVEKPTAPIPAPVQKTSYDPVIVAQIQEQLIRLGLYSGSADGTADGSTQNAVKAYQTMNKIKVDGKPTEDVLVHMLASDMQAAPSAGSAKK